LATARSVIPSLRTTAVEIDGKHGATRFPEKNRQNLTGGECEPVK
jgi:hypothetical protein